MLTGFVGRAIWTTKKKSLSVFEASFNDLKEWKNTHDDFFELFSAAFLLAHKTSITVSQQWKNYFYPTEDLRFLPNSSVQFLGK